MLAFLLLASPIVLTLPMREWMESASQFRQNFDDLGVTAPVIFVFLSAVGTALGLPRLIFCTAGGWLFGFELGFLWSHLGSLAGAYALFLLARHTRPETLLDRYPKLKALSMPVGRGWFSVLVVRQLPLAGIYNDILLAFSPVSHRDFWIGSFVGFLPLGLTASLVGAGVIEADIGRIGLYLASATGVFLVLTMTVRWWIRRAADPVVQGGGRLVALDGLSSDPDIESDLSWKTDAGSREDR